MTKTPEELTEDWKAGELEYCLLYTSICQEFGCAVSDLESSRRGRPYVQAKSVAIRFLRLAGLSSTQVGAILDKDHSTVVHAEDVYKRQILIWI